MVVAVWIIISSKGQRIKIITFKNRVHWTGNKGVPGVWALRAINAKVPTRGNGRSLFLSYPVWKLVVYTSSFNMLHSFAGPPCCYYWLWEIKSMALWWKLSSFKVVKQHCNSAGCPPSLLRCGKEPRVTWSSLQHVIAAVCCHSQIRGLTGVQASWCNNDRSATGTRSVSLCNQRHQVFIPLLRQYACSYVFTFVVKLKPGIEYTVCFHCHNDIFRDISSPTGARFSAFSWLPLPDCPKSPLTLVFKGYPRIFRRMWSDLAIN